MAILSGILGSSGSSSSSLSDIEILNKLQNVDGHTSGLDADLLDGYHASHFATQTSLLNLEQKVNTIFPLLSRVVFAEEFTGDGSSTTFTLSGNVVNAIFATGSSWNASQIIITKQAHITDEEGKPIYHSSIPLLKQRIFVTNISSSGVVTLNYAPLNGQKCYIWYWYQLSLLDSLTAYERDDFVAQIEEEGTNEAWNVSVYTGNFNNVVLNSTHNTVQKALEQLDETITTLLSNTHNITGGLTQLNHTFVKKNGDTFSGTYHITGSSSFLFKINATSDDEVFLNDKHIKVTNSTLETVISGGKILFNHNTHQFESVAHLLHIHTPNFVYEFRNSGIIKLKNISCEDIESSTDKVLVNGSDGSLVASSLSISDVATQHYVNTQVATKQDPVVLNDDSPIISITQMNGYTWNFSHNGFPDGTISNPGIKFHTAVSSGIAYQYINANEGNMFISILGVPILTLESTQATNGLSQCKLIGSNFIIQNQNSYSIPLSSPTNIIFSDSDQYRWILSTDIYALGVDGNGVETGRSFHFISYNNNASSSQTVCSISRDINGYFDIFNRLRLFKPLQLFTSLNNPSGSSAGEVYYNTATNEIRFYNGTSWQTIGSSSFSGFPDGSATSPSMYFSNQSGLGFFRPASGVIAIASSGSRVWNMDAGNGVMSFLNLSVSTAFAHPYAPTNVVNPRIQSRITKSNDGAGILRNIVALAQHDPDNGGFGPGIILARSRGSTSSDYAIVANGDNLGIISFQGSNGNNRFAQAARMFGVVTSTPSPSATTIPGSIVFETHGVEAMRINHQQYIGIGVSTPSCALHISHTITPPTPSSNEVLIGGGQIKTGKNIFIDSTAANDNAALEIRTPEWKYNQVKFYWTNTQMGALEVDNAGRFNVVGPATNNAVLKFLCGPSFSEYVVCKNEVGVKIYARSSDPTTGLEEGFMYYNTTTKKLRVYDGASWVDV